VDKLGPATQDDVFAEGTLPKHGLHSIRGDLNTVSTVRYIEEFAVTLRLREGHEPWCAKVPEHLRFAVEELNELAHFHGGGCLGLLHQRGGAQEVATDIAGVGGQGAGMLAAPVSMARNSNIFSTIILGKARASAMIVLGVRSNAEL
jgi:hypothetical protein